VSFIDYLDTKKNGYLLRKLGGFVGAEIDKGILKKNKGTLKTRMMEIYQNVIIHSEKNHDFRDSYAVCFLYKGETGTAGNR